MFKFILLASLFVTNAFAATVMLEKEAYSGFVMPEYSFAKKCKILSDGQMQSTESEVIQISKKQTLWIKTLIAKAQTGLVEIEAYPCDAGTTFIKGWVDGELVELDNAQDCGERRVNNSPSVEFLRNITQSICGF